MTYIMECALCLALLYLPFWGLLRKETFFHFNRYALLAITMLSFILPLISIPEITTPLANNEILSIQLEEINVMVSGKALSESISWKTILSAIYLTGLVVCLLYKIYDLIQLLRFIPRGCLWTLKENGIHVHCHVHDIASFSWMNHIVISEKDYEEKLSVQNSGSIDNYVRVTLRKSWQDEEGKKTNLSPELIELDVIEGNGWVVDDSASTEERTVLYYTGILPVGAETPAFTESISIDPIIGTKVIKTVEGGVVTYEHEYNGYKFVVEADVDAVQTHNAADAIKSAWGVDVAVSADGSISLR